MYTYKYLFYICIFGYAVPLHILELFNTTYNASIKSTSKLDGFSCKHLKEMNEISKVLPHTDKALSITLCILGTPQLLNSLELVRGNIHVVIRDQHYHNVVNFIILTSGKFCRLKKIFVNSVMPFSHSFNFM